VVSEATKDGVIAKKKLSHLEAREYSTIEQRIAEAEAALEQKKQRPKIHPSPRTPLAFSTRMTSLNKPRKRWTDSTPACQSWKPRKADSLLKQVFAQLFHSPLLLNNYKRQSRFSFLVVWTVSRATFFVHLQRVSTSALVSLAWGCMSW
jgi:hypothetical protein